MNRWSALACAVVAALSGYVGYVGGRGVEAERCSDERRADVRAVEAQLEDLRPAVRSLERRTRRDERIVIGRDDELRVLPPRETRWAR